MAGVAPPAPRRRASRRRSSTSPGCSSISTRTAGRCRRWCSRCPRPTEAKPLRSADEATPRDSDPVRPVVGFVHDLVRGLLDLEHRQRATERRLVRRREPGADRTRTVAAEKRVHRVAWPPVEPCLAARGLSAGGRVRERADDSRDVAQRGVFAPPLGEWTERLALEVDDHPVTVGTAERLTEVQVAVVTDLLHTAEPGERRDEPRHAQSASRIAEGGVRTLDLIADRRVPCREVGVGDGLRREVRVVRPSGERLVEAARHLTETSDRLERRSSRAQLVEQPFPAVPRTRDELLHDGEGGGAAVPTPVLELTEEAGSMGEARVLGEEPRHLGLGIDTIGEPPERLHDRDVAEDDRGVALLPADAAGGRPPARGGWGGGPRDRPPGAPPPRRPPGGP